MIDTDGVRYQQCVLLDWGDTVMRVFPDYTGPMAGWPRVEVVPGVVEAVRQMRPDARVCLATNAADSDERAINTALARVGLDSLFDEIFCFEVVGFRKPSEEYYRTVLKKLGLPHDNVFMVGDDFDSDVVGATRVGIRSVWLNSATTEKPCGALYATVHTFDTLLETLVGLGFSRF